MPLDLLKRSEKGSALTHNEVDQNWTDIETFVDPIDQLNIKTGVTLRVLGNGTTTINVAPSGGDFTTLQAALDSLDTTVKNNETVIISIADGTYTATSPVLVDQANAGCTLQINGANTYTKTMSSVQSSSGSAGAWSVIINLNNVTNIAVGDYVGIHTASGGTLPSYILGCHEVTNVDAGNSRITITSKHKAATAPSGAVAATVVVFKAILKFNGCDGIDLWNGGAPQAGLDNLAIVGDGSGSYNGLSVQDLGRSYTTNILGIAGFGGSGVVGLYGSHVNGEGFIISSGNGSTGFSAQFNSSVVSGSIIASGNGSHGASLATGSTLQAFTNSAFTGNTGSGIYCESNGTSEATATVSGNTRYGSETGYQGRIRGGGLTASNNTLGTSLTSFREYGLIVEGDNPGTSPTLMTHAGGKMTFNAGIAAPSTAYLFGDNITVMGDGVHRYIGAGESDTVASGNGMWIWSDGANNRASLVTNGGSVSCWVQALGSSSNVNLSARSGTVNFYSNTGTGFGGTNTASVNSSGSFISRVAGGGLQIKEGTNATMGVATLTAGAVTVSTTAVTANSRIFLTVQALGTVSSPKAVGVTARVAGTSFTITSADGTDTSSVAWIIVEPSP